MRWFAKHASLNAVPLPVRDVNSAELETVKANAQDTSLTCYFDSKLPLGC